MNKVIIIGRLTKQPEIRQTQSGSVAANFTLAVDRPFSNKDGNKEADFIPVVAWNKKAEVIGKYLDKGSKCAISGRIQTRSYTTDDGSKRYITEVFADEVEFLDSKQKTAQNQSDGFAVDDYDYTDIEQLEALDELPF